MNPKNKTISNTSSILISLLNNIDELITVSNKRKEAKDVMKAIEIFLEKNKYVLYPTTMDKIHNFYEILYDSRPYTLSAVVKDIASDILSVEKS